MTNKERAKARADELDELIIDTLSSGQSFRVEAGAGAGKTHSLMKVIDWLEHGKKRNYEETGRELPALHIQMWRSMKSNQG